MITFDELIKIVELLVSVVGIVLVIIGLILPFKQSIELNKLRLNTTIKSCPKGFPFALKIREVTPIKDAYNVR